MRNETETNFSALIANQNDRLISQNRDIVRLLQSIDNRMRPKTNREVLQEMKAETPELFEELLEVKLRETSLGEVIQEYARQNGKTPDEFLKHTEQVAKEILSDLDESRRITHEENRARETKRAELIRRANEI